MRTSGCLTLRDENAGYTGGPTSSRSDEWCRAESTRKEWKEQVVRFLIPLNWFIPNSPLVDHSTGERCCALIIDALFPTSIPNYDPIFHLFTHNMTELVETTPQACGRSIRSEGRTRRSCGVPFSRENAAGTTHPTPAIARTRPAAAQVISSSAITHLGTCKQQKAPRSVRPRGWQNGCRRESRC